MPLPRVAELEDAERRPIVPLPAGALAYGVFAPLIGKHLADTAYRVVWFRRQLSAASPVAGDTEAHLLLTIAAALYAMKIPADEVKKNRCAVFIDVVAWSKWRRVVRYVPEARLRLDEILTERPDALTCGDEVVRVLRAEVARL